MMDEFIASLPTPIAREVIVDDERLSIPTNVDIDEFHMTHIEDIEVEELSHEKAVFVALQKLPKRTKSLMELLLKKGR